MLIPYLKSLSELIKQHEIDHQPTRRDEKGIEISNCPQHLALSNPTNGPHPKPQQLFRGLEKPTTIFSRPVVTRVDKCPGAGVGAGAGSGPTHPRVVVVCFPPIGSDI